MEALIQPFVFLSYAHEDSERVTRLKTDLQSQGIQVWIDQEGLQPGTIDWEEALRTAMRAAQVVLLIASPSARSSRYVKDELRIAEMYQRPVYPLWIIGEHWMEAVPMGWGGSQYIDAREQLYEKAIPELIAALRKVSSMVPKIPEPAVEIREPRNPYKGLRAFSNDDAPDFFGRDTLINELVIRLESTLASEEKKHEYSRLLAVIGPSGSGKSSVVMAGLFPRLLKGRLPGSEQWIYLDPIVPGAHPVEALTLALSGQLPARSLKAIREDLEEDQSRGLHLLATGLAKRPGTKVVLLVDQFEEVFTQVALEDERRHFIDLLVVAATEPRSPVIVLITLRADFYDRPMRYPQLHQLIQAQQTSVLAMSIQDLREVIEKPAALPDVSLTFEGDLVGDLLFEVQGQVGALPLLQFTLDQLYQRRSGRHLTLSAYHGLGGVKGALTRQAEETYTELPSDGHRKLARALFMRLIDPGASEQDTTRRRAALSEFSLADATQTRLQKEVVDTFIAARLLTTNEIAGTTTVEVSHEALIREWPRLAAWLREARDDIRLQQTISEDATEWERHKKPGDRLYRGSQLKEARAWATHNIPSSNEVAFLHASITQRTRSIMSLTIILLLLLSTTGITGWLLSHPSPNSTLVSNLQDNDYPGSLRYAIDRAPAASTITFEKSLNGTILLTRGDLNIAKDLKISGPGAHLLSISGGGSDHYVHVERGFTVAISGLTFKNSKNSNGFITNDGTFTLINSIVGHSSIANSDDRIARIGDPITRTGRGIINSGTLTLINSTISSNSGNGITSYNSSSILTLTNSTISSNSGNGIDNGGTLTLTNSTISSNSGNGIDNGGTLTLTNSTISSNSGNGIASGGTFTITNDTIFNNFRSSININNSGALTLTNSTVSANSGGGILIQNIVGYTAPVNLTFSTIYDNAAYGNSYDIMIHDLDISGNITKQLSQVKIRNSIVASNPAHPHPDIVGELRSYGYNLFQSNSSVTFSSVAGMQHGSDKMLSGSDVGKLFTGPLRLQDKNDLTETYALAPGSPALGQVPLQYCQDQSIFNSQSQMYTDQRGRKRPDGNEQVCDIGAYEYAA